MSAALPEPAEVPDTIRELLRLRLVVTLGTVNTDGTPHLTPIWFRFDGGRLYLPTGSTSRKVRNLRARPDATVLIDQRQPACHRWALATGTASILGGAEAAAINARVRHRYVNVAGEQTYGRLIAEYDDVTVVVTPARWRSWTPTALDQLAAEHGLDGDAVSAWFEAWDC